MSTNRNLKYGYEISSDEDTFAQATLKKTFYGIDKLKRNFKDVGILTLGNETAFNWLGEYIGEGMRDSAYDFFKIRDVSVQDERSYIMRRMFTSIVKKALPLQGQNKPFSRPKKPNPPVKKPSGSN
jgi:hypothetical protein